MDEFLAPVRNLSQNDYLAPARNFSLPTSPTYILQAFLLATILYLSYRHTSRPQNGRRLPPGPRPLPIIGNLLDLPPKGMPEYQHWLKHKDLYGDVSSVNVLGQTIVLINDKEAAQHIMCKKSLSTSGRPQMNFGSLCGFSNVLIILPFGDTYRRHRRLVHEQFGSRVASAEYLKIQELGARQTLVKTLEQNENLYSHLKYQAASTIVKTMYGYVPEIDRPDPLVSLVAFTIQRLCQAYVPAKWLVDMLPWVDKLPEGLPGTGYKKTARQWAECNSATADIPFEFVKDQMAAGLHRPSFVSRIIEKQTTSTRQAVTQPSEWDIKWAAMSIYGAGADSQVEVLRSFILGMVMFPEAQKKARDELDRVIGLGRLPAWEDREKLPIIWGVTQEAFRWSPIGPLGIAHQADEDVEYKDMVIPKGAILMPLLWSFLHDPAVYHEPEDYMPERYMAPHNEPEPAEAFGMGRRSCSGRYFAEQTVFMTVAYLLQSFEFHKARDEHGNEIPVKLEVAAGMEAHIKDYAYSVKLRSEAHGNFVREVAADMPRQAGGDSGFLKRDIQALIDAPLY